MKQSITLLYDGSFNGFLTAVYQAFSPTTNVVAIEPVNNSQTLLFSQTKFIESDKMIAQSVWNGLAHKNSTYVHDVYFSFLSGQEGMESLLLSFIRGIMGWKQSGIDPQLFSEASKRVRDISNNVAQEKKRFERNTLFEITDDNVYFAYVNAKHNSLPLLTKIFRQRYGDQDWLIIDSDKNYGLLHHKGYIGLIHPEKDQWPNAKSRFKAIIDKLETIDVGDFNWQQLTKPRSKRRQSDNGRWVDLLERPAV